MDREDELVVIVGKADSCELFSRVFAFPDDGLVAALRDGFVSDDAESCLRDAGRAYDASALRRGEASLDGLRIEYTRLYLAPGAAALVFPYESAFIHAESGREGAPALFRTPITLDVESQMREAGVVPKNARKEPCDSVFQELEFLSYLYGSLAAAIQQGDADAEKAWQMRINRFLDSHALRWMPAFMERTVELSADSVYGSFAKAALALLDCLSDDAQSR